MSSQVKTDPAILTGLKKHSWSQNLKFLSQKTKIWHNNVISRRFQCGNENFCRYLFFNRTALKPKAFYCMNNLKSSDNFFRPHIEINLSSRHIFILSLQIIEVAAQPQMMSMNRLLKFHWVGSQNLSCMRRTVTQ